MDKLSPSEASSSQPTTIKLKVGARGIQSRTSTSSRPESAVSTSASTPAKGAPDSPVSQQSSSAPPSPKRKRGRDSFPPSSPAAPAADHDRKSAEAPGWRNSAAQSSVLESDTEVEDDEDEDEDDNTESVAEEEEEGEVEGDRTESGLEEDVEAEPDEKVRDDKDEEADVDVSVDDMADEPGREDEKTEDAEVEQELEPEADIEGEGDDEPEVEAEPEPEYLRSKDDAGEGDEGLEDLEEDVRPKRRQGRGRKPTSKVAQRPPLIEPDIVEDEEVTEDFEEDLGPRPRQGRGRKPTYKAVQRPQFLQPELEDEDDMLEEDEEDRGQRSGRVRKPTAKASARYRSPSPADKRRLSGRSRATDTKMAFMELAPTKAKRTKRTAEDEALRKSELVRKRRMMVERLAEEKKTSTIQKILDREGAKKRKEEKLAKKEEAQRAAKATLVTAVELHYVQNEAGTTLSFQSPKLVDDFKQKFTAYPDPDTCTAPGCRRLKRYSCSTTQLPICSLVCYRKLRATPTFLKMVRAAQPCSSPVP